MAKIKPQKTDEILRAAREILTAEGTNLRTLLYRDIFLNALSCQRDNLDILDLMVINRALAEFRHAANVFKPNRRFRKVSFPQAAAAAANAATMILFVSANKTTTSANAYRLQGKLLLVVGEMDKNVDPASTYQVVNALIKANKVFDLLVIPGAGHGSGGAYGERKRNDFFVHSLLGVDPPDWNLTDAKK